MTTCSACVTVCDRVCVLMASCPMRTPAKGCSKSRVACCGRHQIIYPPCSSLPSGRDVNCLFSLFYCFVPLMKYKSRHYLSSLPPSPTFETFIFPWFFFFLYHQLMLHAVSNYCKNLVKFSLISTLFRDSWSRSKCCVEMCDDGDTSCYWTWIKSPPEPPALVPRTLNTKAFLCSLVSSPVVESILWSVSAF